MNVPFAPVESSPPNPSASPPDEAIIQQWINESRDGSEDAFARIVETYAGKLQSVLYRMLLDWEEARDVAQEVFIRAHRALPRYRPDGKFQSWLFQIGVRVALDAIRGRNRRPKPAPDSEGQGSERGAEDRSVARNEITAAVENAVATLPPEQRAAFILSEYEGFGNREIAEMTEASVKSVEMHLYRARQALREKLKHLLDPQ